MVILFKAHLSCLSCTSGYWNNCDIKEDTEVVIGPDDDEAEAQTSSESEDLSLADPSGAFKGKTFDFSLKLDNPAKTSEFQTVQIGKAGIGIIILSSVANLKAYMVQKMSQLPNASTKIESVEYG